MEGDPVSEVVAERVRQHMKDSGASQNEVARILGESKGSVSMKLAGLRRFTLTDVARLAAEWAIPVAEFIGDEIKDVA